MCGVKVDWLSIHKCDAVDEGAHVLSELLRNEHGIERFDLIENDIGWAGANEIGIHLKVFHSHLPPLILLSYSPSNAVSLLLPGTESDERNRNPLTTNRPL